MPCRNSTAGLPAGAGPPVGAKTLNKNATPLQLSLPITGKPGRPAAGFARPSIQ
jgi:hypothetical protein